MAYKDGKSLLFGTKAITGEAVTVDDELSTTSENPVQNKVVTAAISERATTEYVDGALISVSAGNQEYTDTAVAEVNERVNGLPTTEYVDTAIGTRVEKRASGSGNTVYASKVEDGVRVEKNEAYSTAANAFQIAQRESGGRLKVGDPTEAAHAVTKKYADGEISKVDTKAQLALDLMMGSMIADATVEDTYATRETAGGLTVVNGVMTSVRRISGATVASDGALFDANLKGIRSTGKNIIDLSGYDGATFGSGNGSISANNNTITVTAANGQNVRNTGIIKIDASMLQDGETYTFYQDTVFGSDGYAYQEKNAIYWSINEINKETAAVNSKTTVGGNGCHTITIDRANYDYTARIQAGSYQYNGEPLDSTVSFMIFRRAPASGAAVTYEPYKEDNTFSLSAPVPLGKWDYIDVAEQKVVRKTGTVILNGAETEAWSTYSVETNDGTNYRHVTAVSVAPDYGGATPVELVSSESFEAVNLENETLPEYGVIVGQVTVATKNSFATNDEWLAHLAENPLTIKYEKATATEEAIVVPKTYTIWNGGSETIEQGENDNTQLGALCTVEQEYFIITGGASNAG